MDETKDLQTETIIPGRAELEEILQPVAEALGTLVRERLTPVIEELAKKLTGLIGKIAKLMDTVWDGLLQSVATRKEWHFYKHAKKRRVRKKYKRRLETRLLALLGSEGDDE